ncbi:DUF4111 domain-containing protein [Mycobacterium sp. 21AC1]|uniref:aminoglycoside adenylyltransferase domain-containing protein n=1 Tax=[Mycobacterium] appelbergii TaxID=2939269 RepID=UPI002939186B|nr:aminoglycoside adenylyltransferase domain-containing protein [Mycobacterium sp. 21AC1]MDV3126032.1 DUF4111 domain-containing protein [Mycobacterium sp. 21AC1]
MSACPGAAAIETAIAGVLTHLTERGPGGVLGVYLYGSTVVGGAQLDSDIDLLVVTREALSVPERESLTRLLLNSSGWKGHANTLPEAATRRPIELTSFAIGSTRPWEPEPRYDYQFGEWLRHEFLSGMVPGPTNDPDAVLLVATALAGQRTLHGPALSTLIAPVPEEKLRDAALAVIPALREAIVGDERNVLLTLARIAVTVESGRIMSKDAAAEAVVTRLAARAVRCSNWHARHI